MKLYAVRFGACGFMGKRGVVEDRVEAAVLHWRFEEAKEWADVLGGEVVVWDGVSDDVTVAVPEEPF
jgi:hypothetical protein